MTDIYRTREEWLVAALWKKLDAHFTAAGFEVPSNIKVTCGWPSRQATARKIRRIGECWDSTASADTQFEIFISPLIDDRIDVIAILLHEVIHATVGLAAGHRAPFSQAAKKLGLMSPWTQIHPSEELKVEIAGWLNDLGEYPHGKIDVAHGQSSDRKQSTRMLKLECGSCGTIVRTSHKWLEYHGGEWPCPCGSVLVHPLYESHAR
jgi:hypothetical protein